MAAELKFPAIDRQLDKLRQYAESPVKRVPSGFTEVDKYIRGVAPGEVCMFLGRSHAGKSLIGQQIAVNNADLGSMFFSLEMSSNQALQRMCSMWAKVNAASLSDELEAGYISDLYYKMADALKKHRVIAEDDLSLDRMSAFLEAYDMVYGEPPSFVVIDYLELIGGGKSGGEGWLKTEGTATQLKNWAKQEEMRVFILHQTNRNESQWKAPTQDSARGAGYTESDFVIGLWQPSSNPELSYQDYLYMKNQLFFNVIKNRPFGLLSPYHHPIKYQIDESLNLYPMQLIVDEYERV